MKEGVPAPVPRPPPIHTDPGHQNPVAPPPPHIIPVAPPYHHYNPVHQPSNENTDAATFGNCILFHSDEWAYIDVENGLRGI